MAFTFELAFGFLLLDGNDFSLGNGVVLKTGRGGGSSGRWRTKELFLHGSDGLGRQLFRRWLRPVRWRRLHRELLRVHDELRWRLVHGEYDSTRNSVAMCESRAFVCHSVLRAGKED
jgi:hypothetical protein